MPPFPSRTVFVANVPYDVSEEQLASVFSEVGPVQNVEIKFDQQTGRSKGYAFVLYYDDATALSAIRNLQDVPINGRNLRVEAASDDPGYRGAGRGGGGGGRGGGGGAGGPGGYGRKDDTPPPARSFSGAGGGGAYGAGLGDRVDLGLLPGGQDLAPGVKATDAISQTLAAVSPGQMQEVMAGMKALIASQPDQARQLLASKPQLAYALFQAMLLLNLIDPAVAQRIQPVAPAQPHPQSYPPPIQNQTPLQGYPAFPPTQPPQPPSSYPPYPPSNVATSTPGYRPPQPPQPAPGYGGAPPPPSQAYGGYGQRQAPPQAALGIPASAQAQLELLPQEQRDMLIQVLQLTPEQVNALDPGQKASVMQLRQQFLGAAA